MIQVEDIKKQYDDRIILDHFSLQIPKGKITSLIGPNGAGKSTLLSVISRLAEKDGGKILIEEKDLKNYKSNELAKKLSILKQTNELNLKLTVGELVAFGRFPHSKGNVSCLDREKIKQALEFLSLEELEHAYIDELSGGQRQRAFLAMVVAQDTEYILLDEPLNNLDMKHSVQIMKILRRLADELGKTIVIVIHEINFASNYSDFIVAMKDGKIEYFDETNLVIDQDKLNQVFGINFEIMESNGKKICNYFNL